jgi:hypothetical protein
LQNPEAQSSLLEQEALAQALYFFDPAGSMIAHILSMHFMPLPPESTPQDPCFASNLGFPVAGSMSVSKLQAWQILLKLHFRVPAP